MTSPNGERHPASNLDETLLAEAAQFSHLFDNGDRETRPAAPRYRETGEYSSRLMHEAGISEPTASIAVEADLPQSATTTAPSAEDDAITKRDLLGLIAAQQRQSGSAQPATTVIRNGGGEWAKTTRTVVIGGLIVAGVLYVANSCANDDVGFGQHSKGGTTGTEATIENVRNKSDIDFLAMDVNSHLRMVGVDEFCFNPLPWGPDGCAPYSVYDIPVDTDGTIDITAPAGSLSWTFKDNKDGGHTAVVSVDTEALTANLDAEVIPSSESYGWASIQEAFSSDDNRHEFEEIADQFAEEQTLATCMDTVESQGTALDAAIADALRVQFATHADGLEDTEPSAAELYREMAQEDSTFILDHGGNSMDFDLEQEYTPGETIDIDGIDITFGESQPCNVDPEASETLGDLQADNSITVINDPRFNN
jgi:hypothetical protein